MNQSVHQVNVSMSRTYPTRIPLDMFKICVCGVSVIKNKSMLNIRRKSACKLELLLFGTTNSPVLRILIVLWVKP